MVNRLRDTSVLSLVSGCQGHSVGGGVANGITTTRDPGRSLSFDGGNRGNEIRQTSVRRSLTVNTSVKKTGLARRRMASRPEHALQASTITPEERRTAETQREVEGDRGPSYTWTVTQTLHLTLLKGLMYSTSIKAPF